MAATQALSLNERFGIAGVAEVIEGQGGLSKVRVTAPSATGEIYLHGAHVTSWKPAGAEEVIFMSPNSRFEDGRAIRGGVPICFPWFGDNSENPKAPAHGFARSRSWQLNSIEKTDGAVTVSMSLESDDATRQWWPADFKLTQRTTFGQELMMVLSLVNTGTAPLRYEAALHTYYRIGDISQARVIGLDGVHYLDKTDAGQEKVQPGDIVITSETDRVYLNTTAPVEIVDPVLRRRIIVEKDHSRTTVVWNPWLQKAQSMADLGDTAWPTLVCVEVANAKPFATVVAPGEQHSMTAVSRVSAL